MKRLSLSLLCTLLFIATVVSAAETPAISKGLVPLTLSRSYETALEFDCNFGGILCPSGGCHSEASNKDRHSSRSENPPGGGDNEETRLVISNEGGPTLQAVAQEIALEIFTGQSQGRGKAASPLYSVRIETFEAVGARHLVLNDPECGRWSSQVSLNRDLVPAPVPLSVNVNSNDGSGTFSTVIPIPLTVTFREVVTNAVITEEVMVDLYLSSNYGLINPSSSAHSNFVPFVISSANEFTVMHECADDLRHSKASFCFEGNASSIPLW